VKAIPPDGMEVVTNGYAGWAFGRWMEGKGMDPSKPYLILEDFWTARISIKQDDKYTFKWIGDKYIECY
jgi:hypothetical protein